MTLDGHPETERELTLSSLPGAYARDLVGLSAGLSLVDAADRCGVPVIVMQRWCADGTVPHDSFFGHVGRPSALRIDPAWVDGFVERGEVRL